jgi:dienelactone hydrolase
MVTSMATMTTTAMARATTSGQTSRGHRKGAPRGAPFFVSDGSHYHWAMNKSRWGGVLLLLFAGVARADAPASYPAPEVVRAAFLDRLDRPKVPLASEVLGKAPEAGGLVAERIRFASEKKADGGTEWVPALLIRPEKADGRRPVVIVLHGTGGSKDGERERSFMVELAKRGILAVSFDARYHGERSGGAPKAEAYNAAIVRAWRAKPGEAQEHPWYLDTCWDIWRTLDYLETRPDVDASRIGMIGFSMGGIETWLAGAVDPRVKVAVPAISVQSFRWTLENDRWQGRADTIKLAHEAAALDMGKKAVDQAVCRALWNKVIPGLLDDFDGPSMIRLFAPDRPLLILSSDDDPNCPIVGARMAFAAAEKAFGPAAKERLGIDVAAGAGHRVTEEQRQHALDWFERWLLRREDAVTPATSDPRPPRPHHAPRRR